VPVGIKVAK